MNQTLLECLSWAAIKSRAAEVFPQPAVALAKINVAARKSGAIQADGQVDLKPLLAFLVAARHAVAGEKKGSLGAVVDTALDRPKARKVLDVMESIVRENEVVLDLLMSEMAESADLEALV